MTLAPGLWKATVRGVPDTTVMVGEAYANTMEEVGYHVAHAPQDITDARPLIVLDLVESQVSYLRHALNRWIEWSSLTDEKRTLGGLLSQIEAQTKPPRIPEPGLWGVVEADCGAHSPAQTRTAWVHIGSTWNCPEHGFAEWDVLVDPILIRDGVS